MKNKENNNIYWDCFSSACWDFWFFHKDRPYPRKKIHSYRFHDKNPESGKKTDDDRGLSRW